MSTPEKKVKDKIRKVLREAGAWHCMPATYGLGASGVPDIVGVYKGRGFAIEAKAGKNKPTALQQAQIDAFNAAGGVAWVIDGTDPVRRTQELLTTLLSSD